MGIQVSPKKPARRSNHAKTADTLLVFALNDASGPVYGLVRLKAECFCSGARHACALGGFLGMHAVGSMAV
jgi:hypothetical protein